MKRTGADYSSEVPNGQIMDFDLQVDRFSSAEKASEYLKSNLPPDVMRNMTEPVLWCSHTKYPTNATNRCFCVLSVATFECGPIELPDGYAWCDQHLTSPSQYTDTWGLPV